MAPAPQTDGFESVLDVLSAALPTRDLTWHYRSRDERLIAFANAQMYDGRLTTFPGTAIDSAVVFEPVDGQAVVQAGVDTIETAASPADLASLQRAVQPVIASLRRDPTTASAIDSIAAIQMQTSSRATRSRPAGGSPDPDSSFPCRTGLAVEVLRAWLTQMSVATESPLEGYRACLHAQNVALMPRRGCDAPMLRQAVAAPLSSRR